MSRYNNQKYLDLDPIKMLDEIILQEIVVSSDKNAIKLSDFKKILDLHNKEIIDMQKYFFKNYNWKNKNALKSICDVLNIIWDIHQTNKSSAFRQLWAAATWRYNNMPGKNKEDVFKLNPNADPYMEDGKVLSRDASDTQSFFNRAKSGTQSFFNKGKDAVSRTAQSVKGTGQALKKVIENEKFKRADIKAKIAQIRDVALALGFGPNNCSPEIEEAFINNEGRPSGINDEKTINTYIRPVFRAFRKEAAASKIKSGIRNAGTAMKNAFSTTAQDPAMTPATVPA